MNRSASSSPAYWWAYWPVPYRPAKACVRARRWRLRRCRVGGHHAQPQPQMLEANEAARAELEPERAGRAMSARGMKVFMMGAVVCRGELEGLRDLRLICRHVELSRLAAALFLFGGGVWWGSVGWCGCRVG